MFAIRDQENLVRGPFDAKSAKTPGNGVPIKQHPKTPGKGLVTPLAPQTYRAPLGERTGKVPTFKTPGPLTGGAGLQRTQKRSSGKKPKLKIHQASAVQSEPEAREHELEEEPEIEYCPPKITELPDEPDDVLFGPDYDLPQFHGANLHAGFDSFWMHEKGEDGLSYYEREKMQNRECIDALIDHGILEGMEQTDPGNWTPELEQMKQEAKQRQQTLEERYFGIKAARPKKDPQKKPTDPPKSVSTISARSAAAALSQNPRPHFAVPTAAAKARQRGSARETDAPVKRNLPSVASKSTVGYAKGRKVAATLRPKKPQANQLASDEDVDAQAELLRKLTFRQEDQEEDSNPLFENDGPSFDEWFEQSFGNFRLPSPIEEEACEVQT